MAALMLGAGLFLSGCSEGGFDDARVGMILGTTPVRLDGEQVFLNNDQLQCGVRSELWEIQSLGEDRQVGRLTPKARELKFTDDIIIGETQYPYAQIRGEFKIAVSKVFEIRDEGPNTKLVDARSGPVIDHTCFGSRTPPLLMGVRKGNFTQDFPPRFEFRQNGDWTVERILH